MERLSTNFKIDGRLQAGLQEYSIIANTDVNVREKIMHEKQNFYKLFGNHVSSEPGTHITIASFMAREEMEETIFRYMQRILMQHEAFEVALNNYSSFLPGSIHLRVQNVQRFKKIATDLQVVNDYLNSCICPPVNFTKQLHVNVAKDVPERFYLPVMLDYSQRTFHETFMVNELVLLRRIHKYETEKVVNIFRLQPASNTLYN
jgi:2'-5' RNA ligase